MKTQDCSSKTVIIFPIIEETLTDSFSCRMASVLFGYMSCLSAVTEEILWWMRTLWVEVRSLTYRLRLLHQTKRDLKKVSNVLLFGRDFSKPVELNRRSN